jgi:hypothetical protein
MTTRRHRAGRAGAAARRGLLTPHVSAWTSRGTARKSAKRKRTAFILDVVWY